MADERRTVLLSIFATVLAALVIFIASVAFAGGISIDLVKSYVLPLFVSAFTLLVFWGVLYAHQSGKLPWFGPAETETK